MFPIPIGTRNDIDDFEETTLIKTCAAIEVVLDYRGLRGEILETMHAADVVWACELMNRLSDAQLDDAFEAAAYDADIRARFITKIRAKIREGLALRPRSEAAAGGTTVNVRHALCAARVAGERSSRSSCSMASGSAGAVGARQQRTDAAARQAARSASRQPVAVPATCSTTLRAGLAAGRDAPADRRRCSAPRSPCGRGAPGRRRAMPAVIETQIVLAIVGALIMLIVGASLARAFGIAGAANLIRYRAKIEDPKDAVVMLSTLAVGLACGRRAVRHRRRRHAVPGRDAVGHRGLRDPRPHVPAVGQARRRTPPPATVAVERTAQTGRDRLRAAHHADDELSYLVNAGALAQDRGALGGACRARAEGRQGANRVEGREEGSPPRGSGGRRMNLIIQPEAGPRAGRPGHQARPSATIDLAIFRIDRKEIEKALGRRRAARRPTCACSWRTPTAAARAGCESSNSACSRPASR